MLKVTALLLIAATQIMGSPTNEHVDSWTSGHIVSTCIGNVPDCN